MLAMLMHCICACFHVETAAKYAKFAQKEHDEHESSSLELR
jgi:hypothetical protein